MVGSGASADPTVASTLPAAAAATAPPAASVTQTSASPPRAYAGLALGIELGEPTSATVAWFTGKLSVIGALGTGTHAGVGVHLHADAQLELARLRPDLPFRVGLGLRYYHHGYHPASIDELPDTHIGVRASAAVALERGSMQFYAELAPGVDVHRSASCSLRSGASSICPHAQESPLFLELVIGARWFLH